MISNSRTVYVYENWSEDKPILIGQLYIDSDKGREHVSFEYDEQWLKNSDSNMIFDPDLALYRGRQYTPVDKKLFGIFTDSCPDRWGRLLMQRREAIIANRENRKPNKLLETDYLLGVNDESRIGAIRFSYKKGGPFLAVENELATPPWLRLRELESASLSFENDENGVDSKWMSLLLAPGSSLGGARPKATVKDEKGSLWIAKFPSKYDEFNSGAWEKVVYELAGLCGLDITESKLETFSKAGATFLVKRFDRRGRKRLHFSSAMTVLGKIDGAENVSYLDLASFIKSNGANPKYDLKELWMRIAFNMAVSNTDDHLRNHGFILKSNGWRLSPLFDVNPVPYGNSLSLNVSSNDNSISLELLLETAKFYMLEKDEAHAISMKMFRIIYENVEKLAEKYGIGRNAIQNMLPAFSLCAQ